MNPRVEFGKLLENLYSSGIQASQESHFEFLRHLGEAFRSHLTMLHINDNVHRGIAVTAFGGVSAEFANASLAQAGGKNLWFERGTPKLISEGVGDEQGLLSSEEWKSSPFCVDYLNPVEVRHGLGICVLADGADRLAAISVNRDRRRGPYRDHEHRLAHRLLPHLRNIYNLQRRLSWLEAQVASFRAALDRLAFGAILLGRDGNVLFANAEALKIFVEKNGLVERNRRLHAVWVCDVEKLRTLVERACIGLLMPKPDSMVLHDARGAPATSVTISPVAGVTNLAWAEPNAAAVLFAHRLKPTPENNAERLRTTFGFTDAESRLAEQLLSGATLSQACVALDKRMPTLRSQLRSLFDKTGARRQADLLRLLERV